MPTMTETPRAVALREVVIANRKGLHARAAAKFVKLAAGFDAEITVIKRDQSVPGSSIMGLMMLAATPGCAESRVSQFASRHAVAVPSRVQ